MIAVQNNRVKSEIFIVIVTNAPLTRCNAVNCSIGSCGPIYRKYMNGTGSTLCLKKVSTFTLSLTFSNLNGFSKFLHYRKAYEIYYKTHTILPSSP